jgi:hypothetical protein
MKGELSMRSLLLAAAGALVLAAPAAGGGWATAGLGPPDNGLGAGDTWKAEVTVLQHGETPLVGVQPAVIISNDSGRQLRFPAEPTGEPGVYVANVKFPSAGTWRYAVHDGFTQYGGAQLHTFAPVQIGPGSGDGGFALPEWAVGLAFAAAGLTLLFLLVRRTRPATAPVAQP